MDDTDYWDEHTPWTVGDYEELREKRYKLQSYMKHVIPFYEYSGKKVLELGCGGGIDTAEFASHGALVFAVDKSKRNCAITKAILREVTSRPSFVANLDLEGPLPFYSETFDLVYSFGVLHHLRQPKVVLNEAYRVLKKGGNIITMVYNRDSLLFAYSMLHRHIIEYIELEYPSSLFAEWVGRYSEREPAPYTLPYTKEYITAIFEEVGFTGVSVRSYYPVIDLPDERKVKFTLETPEGGSELGWHLIVKAKK